MRSSSGQLEVRCPETPHQALRRWLESFSAAIRDEDYSRGRTLFSPNVVAFGTRTPIMNGLDELIDGQWKPIWSSTSGFAFQLEQLSCGIDGDLAWVAVPWTSRFRQPTNGQVERRGRATYVLRFEGGKWLAIHSHHSVEP